MTQTLAALIPAAGNSTRFGGRNKLLEMLGGMSVLERTVRAFLDHPDVKLIVLASDAATNQSAIRDPQSAIRICSGGASRAHSVRNALALVPEAIEWVAVHDAARPLISHEVIDRTFAAARAHGAAVPALPVGLTVKQAAGPLPAAVQRTVPRHDLWAMQTPQIMRRADLLEAFDRCPIPLEQVTDDAQLLELVGKPVWLVDGDQRNLKITTALDLKIAEVLLRN